jgi:hypothetical protein
MICRVTAIAMLGLTLTLFMIRFAQAHSDPSGGLFLPVPNSANESADPERFKPAPLNIVLHEYLLLPGWVKAPEFDALREWLVAQGFTIVRALAPEPERTYPEMRFRGTVQQFNEAFRVTVMENPRRFPRCYAVFTKLMMPARFAPRGESYIEAYSFGSDIGAGLSTTCH